MIRITPAIFIDENELEFDFIRSSGPGGQNINKVATAVQLRFNVKNSSTLPIDVKERLIKLAGSRITENGLIIIEAKRYRTQVKNREDSVQRLVALIKKASEKPKNRKKTKPSVSARAARVFEKKRRGAIKRVRQYNPDEWE
jgi:ribosome-associated protein